MKNLISNKVTKLMMLCMIFFSCEPELDLPPVDEFASQNLLNSEEGLEALLFSAYRFDHIDSGKDKNEILMNEVTTDMSFVRIGAVEREMKPYLNFNWDASMGHLRADLWSPRYRAIRDANTVLENIESANIDAEYKQLLEAEARYLRAAQYAFLYRYFGVVPLRTTTDFNEQPQALPLPSEEEFFTFIESELRQAASNLLHPSEQTQGNRATKGHAYAVLTKFLLQTKQWEKVVEVTGMLMDLGYYKLFPNYRGTFFTQNEGNREIIVTNEYTNEQGFHMSFQNGAFPPRFHQAEAVPEFEWTRAMANWATQFSMRDGFVDSFDPEDSRAQAIIEQYQNLAGETVNLRTTPNNARSLKYWDNDQIGGASGSNLPYIRYADILLSRAEALNELYGPTPEALELVNQVRTRSIDDPYSLAEVGDKETFRNIILDERGWEFYSEGKRREDLIRHGKYIEYALARGLNAQPHQVFFPYPQDEVDANPELTQREGY